MTWFLVLPGSALGLQPGTDRAMGRNRGRARKRIWPKLTRPEIKNELKEKALRFTKGKLRGGGRRPHLVEGGRGREPHGAEWGQIRINGAFLMARKRFPFFRRQGAPIGIG